jgi:hypothetical protein
VGQETIQQHGAARPPSPAAPAERGAKHGAAQRLACERLRTAGTTVGLARLQLRIGNTQDAAATLELLHEEIQSLREQLEGGREPAAPRRLPRPRGDQRRQRELLVGYPG